MQALAVVNPHLRPERVAPPPGPEVTVFHRGLAGYAPTPLRRLPDIAWGRNRRTVLMKDESDRFGLPAFKFLGASWAVEETLRRHPGTRTLVAASAGNHGRAVARCAARLGLACRIHLPAAVGAERARLIAAEGAEVIVTAGSYDDAAAAAERDGGAPGRALIADFSPSPGVPSAEWVIDGYATLFREITAEPTEPVGIVLVPVGVGSLAAAAVRWAVHEAPKAYGPAVIAVEPVTAACVAESLRAGRPVSVPTPGTVMAGLNCGTPSAPAWPALRDGLAGTIAVSDDEVGSVTRELAALGLDIGLCGAATLAALHRLADAADCGPLRDAVRLGGGAVLCIGTEGTTGGGSVSGAG
ncbi:pyridoxal-phosphate dependent enzyme [Sphaerimonospora sp. CA-214678]|uniref:pyridoxal-phosphate dependent enzyme n=1 Tax=Sphaerimonospora sp. CA-214678 TaxID=3240029 RepID=UPI003D8EFA3D